MLGLFIGLRLEELAIAVDAKPGQPVPILVPAVDDERQLGQHQQVAHARYVVWVVGPLVLLVDRRVEDRPTDRSISSVKA